MPTRENSPTVNFLLSFESGHQFSGAVSPRKLFVSLPEKLTPRQPPDEIFFCLIFQFKVAPFRVFHPEYGLCARVSSYNLLRVLYLLPKLTSGTFPLLAIYQCCLRPRYN